MNDKFNWKLAWSYVLFAGGIAAVLLGFAAGTDLENGSWIIGGPLMGAGIILTGVGYKLISKYGAEEALPRDSAEPVPADRQDPPLH
jgi:hypothetical protein